MNTVARHSILACMLALALAMLSCSKSGGPAEPEAPPAPDPVQLEIPPLFSKPQIPAANPLTRQGIALGRMLYYDPILSADSTEACATCHQFGRAFSDTAQYSSGIDGSKGTRNAPAIINAAWLPSAFWDGREPSIEDQARRPVVNPIEMQETWANVERKLQRHPTYPGLFLAAFGTDQISEDLVVKAIAQFERTFISSGTKYDLYLQDPNTPALTDAERRGANIFFSETADCFHCHGNVLGTDNSFHNIGLDETLKDLGRGDITGRTQDMGKFKTPSLRNVEYTAPYMHDGRFKTLREVVDHYNSGGFPGDNVDPLIRTGVGLGLTEQQINDLIAFLKTFSDPHYNTNPDYANPFQN